MLWASFARVGVLETRLRLLVLIGFVGAVVDSASPTRVRDGKALGGGRLYCLAGAFQRARVSLRTRTKLPVPYHMPHHMYDSLQ